MQAAGRTDAGVHARRQYVQFFIDRQIEDLDKLHLRMNSLLPVDLRVLCVREVPAGFSVRFHALSREYHYRLQYGAVLDPLQRRFVGFTPGELDVPAMEELATCMEGTHDFQAFSKFQTDATNYERTLYSARVVHLGEGQLRFEACSDLLLRPPEAVAAASHLPCPVHRMRTLLAPYLIHVLQ